MQIKSIIRSDLMPLRVHLRFVICSFEAIINLLVLLLLIRTMTYLWEGLLVVILILGFGFSNLLKINLFSSLIFMFESSGKISLILRILLILFKETCASESLVISTVFLSWPGVFFPWNFNGLGRSWGRDNFENLTGLVDRSLLALFGIDTLVVNLSLMSSWNILLFLFVLSWSHPPLNTEETKSNMIWPKLLRNGISASLLFFSFLLLIKFKICMSKILMLLTSISWEVFCTNIEIGLVQPSHKLKLPGWSTSYNKEEALLLIADTWEYML